MIPRWQTCCALLSPVVIWAGLAAPAHAQLVTFTPIPTPVGGISDALGISGNGETVVGYRETNLGRVAFRWDWRSGFVVDLGNRSTAHAVSDDGYVVVGEQGFGQQDVEGYRWLGPTGNDVGTQGLGSLTGTPTKVIARGVSGDGQVIVGESNSPNGLSEAFRWVEGNNPEMQGLGDLGGTTFLSLANAISADGSVVVGVGRDPAEVDRAVAFLDDPAFIQTLDVDPQDPRRGQTLGVSADGSVAVGSFGNGATLRAFRASTSGPAVLLGPTIAQAHDVTADGDIVVGFMRPGAGLQDPFIWDAANGTMVSLETFYGSVIPDEWDLRAATGISADGRVIVGWGNFVPAGGDPTEPFRRGFILDLGPVAVPEPSAGALLILPGLVWVIQRLRQRRV